MWQLIVFKQCPPWPVARGLDPVSPAAGEAGPDSALASKPIATHSAVRAPRGCWLDSSLRVPHRTVRAGRGRAPSSPGSRNHNRTKSKQGKEGCRIWPNDALRNGSNSFLVRIQKPLFYPAFCC